MKEYYALDGVQVKTPTDFDYEWYKITKANRLTNGDMVMDYLSTKRKFCFKYEFMSETDLKVIKGILNQAKCFSDLKYTDGNSIGDATVYPGSLKYSKVRSGTIWVYKEVSFDLIEK